MSAVATQVASPCVRLCKFNEQGHCFGCFRSDTEVRSWAQMTPDEHVAVIDELPRRRAHYWNMPLEGESEN